MSSMKGRKAHAIDRARGALALALALLATSASLSYADTPIPEQIPAELETRFALSAAPPALREHAAVYLLDPQKGYRSARKGTNGVACLVERTVWEWAELRDDIYIPLCYDAVGAKAHLKVIMDAAALRAQGMSAAQLKAEVEKRYAKGTYKAPEKPGLSYMIAPLMRVLGPGQKVQTMSMPHLMFYAPHIRSEDIGLPKDLPVLSSRLHPFIDQQGVAEQTYMIQPIGEAEKAQILADEKPLLDALCAHRDVLCLAHDSH